VVTFTRNYQREYEGRDRATLKRQRGRAYEREIERAKAMGMSIRAMRRATRKKAAA
jgi:hypothetical protein